MQLQAITRPYPVNCPHCRKMLPVDVGESGKRIVECPTEDRGGCDRSFVVDVRLVPLLTVYKLEMMTRLDELARRSREAYPAELPTVRA